MDVSMIRIICAVLAVLFLGLIVLRRRKVTMDEEGYYSDSPDLIEYALMAGFVAVAAGGIMPNVASSIQYVWGKIASAMVAAAANGW